MISVLHIGLPLAAPWLTPEDRKEVSVRLTALQESMNAAGYRYLVMHASPDEGLAALREQLRTGRWDAVLIGGGVASNPDLADFKRQIAEAVRDVAPRTKLLEYDHSMAVQALIERAFAGS